MAAAVQTGVDPQTIPGWGVDADLSNNPTFPMRDRAAGHERGLSWPRPAQQPRDVEVLMSIEHNRLPAVFGTASPPRGLSGAVRRGAFRYSESQWAHWLLLMLADRINMIEGVMDDVARGRAPNLIKEFGLTSATTKAPRQGAQIGFLAAAAFGGGVILTGYLVSRIRAPLSNHERLGSGLSRHASQMRSSRAHARG